MLARLEKQAQIDEMMLAELNSGAYGFESPLVIVDPYGQSPLTALALCTSEEPLNITVHVPGVTKLADVDFTFDGYNTSHMIPIYGLYPGALNKVRLTALAKNDATQSVILEVQTDPPPPEFAKNILIADLVKPGRYQPGFNYTFWPMKSAFDVNGEYRWYFNDFSALQVATIYNYHGNIVLMKGTTQEGDLLIFEINTLGKIMSVCYSPYGSHHYAAAIDNGNLLVTGSCGETIEDFLYEVDMETGEIVNMLDLKRILQRTRTAGSPEYSTNDWFHNNAVIYDGGSSFVSTRSRTTSITVFLSCQTATCSPPRTMWI